MRILIIAAHPDDETIGCAGTMLAHAAHGDRLSWLIVTKADPSAWSSEIISAKEAEVRKVAGLFGIEKYYWPGLPPTRLEEIGLNRVINAVRPVLEETRPDIVYTVHRGDVHSDHRMVFRAVTILLKPFLMKKYDIRRLLSFECLSSTDAAPPLADSAFLPNVFSDITPYIDRKIEILNAYGTEMQPEPLPRSSSAVRALARLRGASIGVEYAEAFMLIREIA